MKGKKLKFYIKTLGCPKNEVDSQLWAQLLTDKGYQLTSRLNDASIVVFNTCSFIDDAKEESIEAVLSVSDIKKNNPKSKIILTGCLAEQYKNDLLDELPEIDAVVGNKDIRTSFASIGSILNQSDERICDIQYGFSFWYDNETFHAPDTFPYAYLKIAEGCNNHCHYCVIPSIRGSYRSLPKETALDQSKKLIDHGFKELILVAQDTTNYGHDLYNGRYTISDLLADINSLNGDFVIRVLYTNPQKVTPELIEALNLPKVSKYLDMPIQHISDHVLDDMGRKITGSQIKDLIFAIKESIPDIALRTSLITGFPTETEDDFEDLLTFVEQGDFLHLGAFSYSPQDGTHAFKVHKNFDRETAEKRKELLEFSHRDILLCNNKKLIGKTINVLIERKAFRNDYVWGRMMSDAPVIDRIVKLQGNAKVGEFRQALILEAIDFKLFGTLI
jgi:ribosomal protein S12 methylthiotransferase